MTTLSVSQVFDTFSEAEIAVSTFCQEHFHLTRIDSKASIRTANKKLSAKSQITDMNTDAIYSCR